MIAPGLCLFFVILMLIMWGKSKQGSAEAPKSNTSAESSGIVVSHISSRKFRRAKSVLKKKKMLYASGLLVLLAVTVGSYFIWQNQHNTKQTAKSEDPPYVATDQEFAKVQAASLRQQKPAQTASSDDKKTYYDDLITNEFTAGNFKGAADSYTEAVAALQESNLGFNAYMSGAQAYAKLGDKAKAESILNIAEQTVKKASYSDETRRTDFLNSIAYVREEIKK